MTLKRKVDIVMNLLYNIVLAILLSLIAEAINAGGVTWPSIAYDSIISYVLEMLIALFLPFTRWGQSAAMKKAVPGTRKFRIICALVTATPFATLMSLAMSFISCILFLGLPVAAFITAWLKIWLLFVVIAVACSYFLVPTFVELAKKILGVPKSYNPFTAE